MFNLSSLSEEEKRILKEELEKCDHPDVKEDAAMLEPLVQAIQLLTKRLEELGERHEMLEEIVMDKLIGSFTSLHEENEKLLSISDLKEGYGSLFEPLIPAYKALVGDDASDIYEKLYDVIQELKEEEGYSDEMKDSKLREIADKLKGKVGAFKSINLPEDGAQPEAEAEIKIEAEGEPDKLKEMLENVKRKKGNFLKNY